MLTSIIARLRHNVVAYVALVVAVVGGGGYAIAATSKPKTITVCANKKTHAVYNDAHSGKCNNKKQTKLSWNQKGPRGATGKQGPKGATGAQGTQGPAGPTGTTASAWGIVGSNGIASGSAHGLTASRLSAGVYRISIITPGCAQSQNTPIVSVSEGNPPSGFSAGAFPLAWVDDSPGFNQQFVVHTGVVSSGSFTASDRGFNVQDVC